tara:strand:+ start:255 stop:917 length:663 start_codon:yes stop_codon:yes gene_type:complete
MLFLKDEIFENLNLTEVNRWSTEYGSDRAPREQLLGGRMWDACQKHGIKNILALWVYGVTKTAWFSRAPRDREGQIVWCDSLAEQFAKLGDIRLLPLTEDEQVIMTLVWTQATARLNEYAKFKKPVEPKLPDPKQKPEPKPVEVKKKGEEPKQREETPPKPKPANEESTKPVEEPKKSGTFRIVGIVAGMLAAVVAWLPIPAALASLLKVIFTAIANLFR